MKKQATVLMVVLAGLLAAYVTSLYRYHAGLSEWVTAGILVLGTFLTIALLNAWHRAVLTAAAQDRAWWYGAGRTFYETLLAVLLVGTIVEIPHFQRVMTRQFSRLLDFPRLFNDKEEMARRFSHAELKQFRSTITAIVRKRDPIADEDRLIDDLVLPVFDGPARDSMEITRNHTETSSGGVPFYVVDERTRYIEYSAGHDSIEYPIGITASPIAGVPRESLYCVRTVCVNGRDIHDVALDVSSELQGGKWAFTTHQRHPPARRAEIVVVVRKRVPLDDKLTVHVRYPTHGLRIKLISNDITESERDEPKLYVFGMNGHPGRPLDPESRQVALREWIYPGWLFVMQGWELTWHHH